MKVLKLCVIALGISALTACGGGSGDSGSTSQPQQPSSPIEVPIEASVVQSKALVNMESDTTVHVSSDIDFRLTSVEQVGNGVDCEVTSIDGMTFTTLSDQIGECQFEYKVEPVEQDVYAGQASSLARVSVSETADNNTLPNLSETTDIDSAVTIDLSEELNSELDTSIYIVSEEVTLLGAGAVEVDSLNNTILYTPIDIGVTRIMYSMSDGSSTKLGNIDVAVSDTGNTPPIANDYIREGKLAKDMSVEIDLTDYVSDAEDSVILDSVRAYNSETEITSVTEHKFSFQSSEPGPHEVAYTVTDGRGGYAVGQVYIEVEADFTLIQDWEDITAFDNVINGDVTFTAPMSKAMADYVNEDYISVNMEDGSQGPKHVQVVQMNWEQAKSYCEHRGGRLPLTRELETLISEQPFPNHNWPTSTPYWTVDKTSSAEASLVSLSDASTSTNDTSVGIGYATCVYLKDDVQDFSVSDVVSNDLGDTRRTTRLVSATLLDPDGNPAPYQDILFWGSQDVGGFGVSNDVVQSLSETNSDGVATAVYEFTSGYEDNVMAQYSESVNFVPVTLEIGSHDPTEPDDWHVSKILGDTELESYEPVISSEGTMISLGDHDQYITSISKNNFMGDSFDIYFTVDRTKATKTNGGAVNVVLQQVSSIAPDINSWCDERIYGSCSWAGAASVGTAGIPSGDDRYLKIAFGYYNNNISVETSEGSIAEGEQPVSSERIVHYRIVNDEGRIRIFYTLDENLENWTRSIDVTLESTPIDPNKFYYLGFSGGASSVNADGVVAYITHLSIEDR
ncbi:Ig-like domain-containing protein [Vibrio pomeroyi]|uniref:Ig-like domain-containing protein n=1 Tax=Vibrio pomeroyi TaxID=198832 RepID=UPI0035A681ED